MVSDLKIGMKCIKYMLFIVNLTFVITSMLLITSGGTIHAIYSDFRHFLSDAWFSPAILMIIVGIIMFFVSAFGCWGAIRESTCMINTFGMMLATIFLVEFAGAVAAFALQHELASIISIKMLSAVETYGTGPFEQREAVDFLQYRLYCCGVTGPEDWPQIANLTMPESCCDKVYTGSRLHGQDTLRLSSSSISFQDSMMKFMRYEDDQETTTTRTMSTLMTTTGEPPMDMCQAFQNGCYHRLVYLIGSSAAILGSGATAVALMQLLGVIFAFSLARAIRRAKSQRAARSWQQRMGHIIGMQAAPYTQLQEKRSTETAPVTYAPSDPSIM